MVAFAQMLWDGAFGTEKVLASAVTSLLLMTTLAGPLADRCLKRLVAAAGRFVELESAETLIVHCTPAVL